MKKKQTIFRLMLLFTMALLAACGGDDFATVPETTQTQFEPAPQNVRDYRYCEIIPIFRSGTTFRAEVYNTIDLNQCPADQWDKLDGEELKEAYGAVDIKMNGPRYWAMNEFIAEEAKAEGKIVDFGGVEMILGAIIDTKLSEGSVGGELYAENQVQRTTTFVYYAGEMVYELTAPDGSVYRMQSYAQIIDPTLTIDDLETLGDQLDLPDGWRYNARTLDERSEMVADGLAFVINDNLGNSYQKVFGEEAEAQSAAPQADASSTDGVPAVTRTQFEEPPTVIRDYRYCEIIPIFREGTTIVAEVYNTFGLNDCPTDLWNALDGDALAESYGAMDIRMNGPRFWVIDELIEEDAAADGKVADFGGIEMILPGLVETKLREGSVGSEFYTENEVNRFTTYTYYAGELVYELISPEGEVYRMQSYAQLVDKDLTIDDLATLGDRLDLPDGWSYQARVLPEETLLITEGLAFVINDNLGSSYQKVTDLVLDVAPGTVPEVIQTQFEPAPQNVRDYRYCEIIPVFRSGTTFRAEVYNTIDLNQCPAELWDELDGEELKETYGAVDIKMNGPRYWAMNEFIAEEAKAEGKIVDFGGVEMILGAIIDTKLREGSVGGELYSENQVQRSTTYVYYAGEMVYELTSPDGSVYRMQSYAQIIDPTLTMDDLANLGDRLDLPEGWSYQARVLPEESLLIAEGLAFVINDDFGNSYQKIPLSQTVLETGGVEIGPNDTGIYTTATGFEHGDAGRTHRFGGAVFGGDFENRANNSVRVRTAPATYPGAYNIVTRNPDELFVYFGVYGDVEESTGPSVALLNADTLEEVWRTSVDEQAPEEWIYPGVIGLHGNGTLYVVGGNVLAALDPDTGEILNRTELPTENPVNSNYNGFVTTSDGTIFVKPIYRTCDAVGGSALFQCPDATTPSILYAIDPDTLEVIAQVEVPEPVISRLIVGAHNGEDFVYMQGVKSLFRFGWDGATLTFDEGWGSVSVLQDGQIGASSPSITEDWLFFNTNGLPDSTTPMTLWAISTQDSNQRFSIDPFADLTEDQSFNVSMGSFDPENSRAYVADTGVGYAASLTFDPSSGFKVVWREEQTTMAFTMLANPADQRVFIASNLTGLGSNLNPFLARNEEVVFRNAATGEELARSENLARMSSGANLVAGFGGRFYLLGNDNQIYELTVE